MIQEDKLIEGAQEGDQEAFCLLARSYQRRIYALALRYTRHPHEAVGSGNSVFLRQHVVKKEKKSFLGLAKAELRHRRG